jgi:hypothetical protein
MTSRFLFHSSEGLSDYAISAFVIVGFDTRKKFGGGLASALKGSSRNLSIDTSLPCAQDTGGENPYIDTKDV